MIYQQRNYRRACGLYYILDNTQERSGFKKIVEAGFETKFLAEKQALIILDDPSNTYNTLYIEQLDYERIPLHEGAPCPWCNKDTLVLVPEECLVVEHLVCNKCGSSYETGRMETLRKVGDEDA